MQDINRVKVTSNTTMLDSISLRKKLREYPNGSEASFTPGVGAFPQTRPGFLPTLSKDCAVHPDFKRNLELVLSLYYEQPVVASPSSYSIRREAKIGFPYNDRSEATHNDFFDHLLNKPFDYDDLGNYVYGTRIQTDSTKIRYTGFVQLKAIGDGFQVQRHRMINAGPAINHVLGIFEFDYHHRWLERFAPTFNCVVDNFVDTGYGFAIDYSHFEHSLGWDILFQTAVEILRKNGQDVHARLYEGSNLKNRVHFRPSFRNEKSFLMYLQAGKSVEDYMKYVNFLYKSNFKADDLVKQTVEAIRKYAQDMKKVYAEEAACPVSPLSGYRIWEHVHTFNSSGVTTTATSAKHYSIADTMCRLSEAFGFRWDIDLLIDFLLHRLRVRVYNLGDDNLIFFDDPVDFEKFLKVQTGVIVTEEIPVSFLSRLLDNEVAPHRYNHAHLIPKAASFYRKLSRERDVFMLKYPSIGFADSLMYAEKNPAFRLIENEVAELYRNEYMSFAEILKDLRNNVDRPMSADDIKYASYIDDTGKLFRDNVIDPSALLPNYFYAVDPVTRDKIKQLYKGG